MLSLRGSGDYEIFSGNSGISENFGTFFGDSEDSTVFTLPGVKVNGYFFSLSPRHLSLVSLSRHLLLAIFAFHHQNLSSFINEGSSIAREHCGGLGFGFSIFIFEFQGTLILSSLDPSMWDVLDSFLWMELLYRTSSTKISSFIRFPRWIVVFDIL
jgi:hypothetical protein